jgi:hypothetical protein
MPVTDTIFNIFGVERIDIISLIEKTIIKAKRAESGKKMYVALLWLTIILINTIKATIR